MDINGTGILQCVNLCRTYSNGRTTAVTDAGFTFHEGRFYMIRGKRGSGKSTFLRMLGGVEAPSKGKVYYCGQDLYQMPDKKLARIRGMKFGFVFQSFNLIPELTVFDNILLPCLLNGFYDRDRVYELTHYICLAVFGIFSSGMCFYSRILTQKEQLGMYQVMGLQKKSLMFSIMIENALYFIFTALFSAAVLIGLSLLMGWDIYFLQYIDEYVLILTALLGTSQLGLVFPIFRLLKKDLAEIHDCLSAASYDF
ncbi:MAG: ATP-binding cassette domain-containing protein [Lachnospiraceae bacterium]|nr:ATP-binding cassette domain-containing protein [Lachnospiraceae bacterium]